MHTIHPCQVPNLGMESRLPSCTILLRVLPAMRAPSTILAASTTLLVLLAAQGALGCRVRRALLQGEP